MSQTITTSFHLQSNVLMNRNIKNSRIDKIFEMEKAELKQYKQKLMNGYNAMGPYDKLKDFFSDHQKQKFLVTLCNIRANELGVDIDTDGNLIKEENGSDKINKDDLYLFSIYGFIIFLKKIAGKNADYIEVKQYSGTGDDKKEINDDDLLTKPTESTELTLTIKSPRDNKVIFERTFKEPTNQDKSSVNSSQEMSEIKGNKKNEEMVYGENIKKYNFLDSSNIFYDEKNKKT